MSKQSKQSTRQSRTAGKESSQASGTGRLTQSELRAGGASTPSLTSNSEQRLQDYEERQHANRVRELWEIAKIPTRHARRIEQVRNNSENDWHDSYSRALDQLGKGVTIAIIGPRGTGKTQAAVCLARDTVENGRSALYTVAADLFDDLRDELKAGKRNLRKRIRRIKLLILDEVHEIAASDWELRELVSLVDVRYREELDTLLIGNTTRDALGDLLGPSIVSRMRESGGVIEFTERFRT